MTGSRDGTEIAQENAEEFKGFLISREVPVLDSFVVNDRNQDEHPAPFRSKD